MNYYNSNLLSQIFGNNWYKQYLLDVYLINNQVVIFFY